MKKLLNLSLALMMLLFIFGISTSVFAASTINESEDNGSYATADKVTAGSTVCGVLNSLDDVDYYKFVAPSNGKLSVDFLHTYDYSSDAWNIAIYRYADGEYTWISGGVVALNDNEKQTIPFVGTVKNSVYYVIIGEDYVIGYNHADDIVAHDYKLKFNFTESNYYEKENNDTYAKATKVNANCTYSGVLNGKSDVDYYKLVAPSNGRLSIDFLHTYDYSSDGWNIEIYRYADGEYTWISGGLAALNGNEKQTIPFVGTVKNSVYYVIVSKHYVYAVTSGDGVVAHDYKLKFNFTESNYYEKEDNGTYAKATKVNLDSRTYTGTINSSDDVDYYKLVAPADGCLDLAFTHKVKTDDNRGWNVSIYSYYDGEYSQIYSTDIYMASNKTTYIPTVGVKKGRTYFVVVSGDAVGEDYKISFEFCLKPVSSLKATPSTNSIKLSWKKVAKADSYQIQQYRNNKWKTIATTESTSYTVKNLSKATKYKFRVRASAEISGKTYYSTYWIYIYTATKPGSTTLKATAGTRKVTLSWNKVTGADSYVIYRATSKNGTYKKVTSVKSGTTKYTDTGLTAGKMYYYKIRAYINTADGVYGAYSSVKSARPTLATPSLKLTAGTKKVTLSWGKVTGASGYVIYRSTSKNGTYSKVATVKSGNTTQYTNKNLTAKKTYYYKIRAYVKVGDTYYYSPYSSVKSVKTK